jgi:hypothetical protein
VKRRYEEVIDTCIFILCTILLCVSDEAARNGRKANIMAMVFRVAREMKTARVLCLSACLFALLPLEAWASWCSASHPQIWYDDADVIVLARKNSNEEDKVEVIRSWKLEISGSLTLKRSLYHNRSLHGGIHLLYLKQEEDGKFSFDKCSGSLRNADLYGDSYIRDSINARIQWLDKISACGCPSRDAQGWYDHADAIVTADIIRIVEKDVKKFADLKVRLTWKTDLPASITVQTDDGHSCGYPVRLEKPPFRPYLLYLHRNEAGQYSTDFCSGNLDPFEYRESISEKVGRFVWLFKQEKPKEPKEPE